MLTAIMADIHANREAFEACLRHAREAGAQDYILLGDIVGYGPDPGWCADKASEMIRAGARAVRGNHEAALLEGGDDFSPLARAAIDWTREVLPQVQQTWLGALPMSLAEGDRLFVHANAWAPGDWDYVKDERTAERSLRYAAERLSFVGHLHVAGLYTQAAGRPAQRHEPRPGVAIPLLSSRRWLIVAGAVGQPRDGNPAAAYCLFDGERSQVTFHRVPYDAETTARKIMASGLPEALAERLRRGR